MANMNIIAVFRDENLQVTIDIRKISDNSCIVSEDDMTEMSDGAYSYTFSSYDDTIDYLFICKASSGDRVYAVNNSVQDQTKTTVDDIENKVDIVDEVVDRIEVDTTSIENKVDDANTNIGIISSLASLIKKALWNKKVLTGQPDYYEEVLYDDDGTTELRKHSISRTAAQEQTREEIP